MKFILLINNNIVYKHFIVPTIRLSFINYIRPKKFRFNYLLYFFIIENRKYFNFIFYIRLTQMCCKQKNNTTWESDKRKRPGTFHLRIYELGV